jgi:MOSC domain-containing protein YiiM
MATLLRIWIKRAHGGPMDPVTEARVVAGRGLLSNADQGGKRQITLIEAEAWEDMMRLFAADVDPGARRANLLVGGLPLAGSAGRTLRVGSLRILVRGETRPCEVMDAAWPGLREVMSAAGRGGVYGEALDDAVIRVGDSVSWEPAP